jgi:hypothetical protein
MLNFGEHGRHKIPNKFGIQHRTRIVTPRNFQFQDVNRENN